MMNKAASPGRPPPWNCEKNADKKAAFEAWTNLMLDARELDYDDALQALVWARVEFNIDRSDPTKPTKQRLMLRDFVKRRDPKLANLLKFPGMAETYQSMAKGGRPKGLTKSKGQKEKELALARVWVRLINQIWKDNYQGRSSRGGNPPTAAQIVLRRLKRQLNINLDRKAIGVIDTD